MKRITIFCASSPGHDALYYDAAFALGQTLAAKQTDVVYGGAKVGLMGAVADGALSKNGTVIGVLPYFLSSKEIAHAGLTKMVMVDSMHERKTKMNELCDGVIALPGGFGTLEELFEMLTWGQLGLHRKPIGLLNINGFYNCLIDLLQTMVDKGFLKTINQEMLLVSDNADDLLEQMQNYIPPAVEKWIDKQTT
jgi:uncharacterized protein (TIGR00730 family)